MYIIKKIASITIFKQTIRELVFDGFSICVIALVLYLLVWFVGLVFVR